MYEHTFFILQSTCTDLTDGESFAGTLLLKYLFNALSNAHEISELLEEKLSPDAKFTSHNLGIGAGLYPLHSLTNHSCDPNVVRHNHKNAIVLRAIQPIRAGDQVSVFQIISTELYNIFLDTHL